MTMERKGRFVLLELLLRFILSWFFWEEYKLPVSWILFFESIPILLQRPEKGEQVIEKIGIKSASFRTGKRRR